MPMIGNGYNDRIRSIRVFGGGQVVVYSDGRTTLTDGFPSVENASFVVKVTKLVRW